MPANYVLPLNDMEQMLADCFLAPISDQGTCLLLGAADAPLKPLPSSTPLVLPSTEATNSAESPPEPATDLVPNKLEHRPDGALLAESTSEPVKAASSDEVVDRPGESPTQGSPPVPQRTRHRRLQRTRRPRASEQPFLGMPWEQYVGIVQWSDAQLRGESRAPPPPEWEAVLRQSGIEPSRWCDAIEHFGELFRRAAGHLDQLAPLIGRAGQQWFQGSRACRDLFT